MPEKMTSQGGQSFEAEFSGPERATSALVLVHGFGVLRDSRGMFTDIREQFEDQMLVASMDLSNPSPEGADAVPFGEQQARVGAVIDYLQSKDVPSEQITLIGHSMGSLIVAQTRGSFTKRILLAPPLGKAYEQFIQTPGWSRPGSTLDVQDTSILQRSDGSITSVSSAFWDEFRAMDDVDDVYRNITDKHMMVYAGDDNVFDDQKPLEDVQYTVIDGANHDFAQDARAKLLETLKHAILN